RHQARVALRRLRSLFRTFAPVVPEAAFTGLLDKVRRLAGRLGEARNLDVFVDETLKQAGTSTHPGMTALKRRAQAARRAAARDAAAAISDKAHAGLMLEFTATLTNLARMSGPAEREAASMPLADFAKQALSRQHAKVKKRGRRIGKLAFEDLHRLRIAIKRLRYSLEFFAPLATKEAQDALDTLAGLQGMLGHLNDDATSWKLLDMLAVKDPDGEYQQAVGFMRGWTARDGEQCRVDLEDAWKRFGKIDRWWK
ncbi:MAG TPA: CHAD domain-containing protein, partial [Burkholderiales bacterium]